MKTAFPTSFPSAGLAASRFRPRPYSARPARGRPGTRDAGEACGGETVIDFALCLLLAVLVVGLLLLAL